MARIIQHRHLRRRTGKPGRLDKSRNSLDNANERDRRLRDGCRQALPHCTIIPDFPPEPASAIAKTVADQEAGRKLGIDRRQADTTVLSVTFEGPKVTDAALACLKEQPDYGHRRDVVANQSDRRWAGEP